MPNDVKEPTTDNVIKQTEGYPSLIEAARVAREAASAILSRTEPMTEEIVKGLRNCANADNPCTSECINLDMAGGCRDKMMNDAADRLESQEWEIERLQGEMFANALESAERIAALTARAEQAERERDAAIADIEELLGQDDFIGICWACKSHDKCVGTRDVKITCVPKWRGLPQDGEGKK